MSLASTSVLANFKPRLAFIFHVTVLSMQVFRSQSRLFNHSRHFVSTTSLRTATPLPWFVDQPLEHQTPPHMRSTNHETLLPVPPDAPEVIKHLHSQLLKSPLLDKSQLVVSSAVLPEPGPPLPLKKPQGRRKRGGTYAGESQYDAVSGGIWSWVVMSQVGGSSLFLSFTILIDLPRL